MNENEIIDAESRRDFFSIYPRFKYALVIFTLLDAVSLLRSYEEIKLFFQYGVGYTELAPFRLFIIVSFAFSAILFMLRKKEALLLYYVQFPIRILFMMMSFGFLIELFGGVYRSSTYWVVIGLVFSLEVLRLIYTILIHRKLNRFH